MKIWKKILCGLLAAALLVPAALAAPVQGTKSLSDVKGHWAQEEIEAALADGWVGGYPDGSFRPEGVITRAEFMKMLLGAVHLTEDSDTVKEMTEHAKMQYGWQTVRYNPWLTDTYGHWFDKQGWLKPAFFTGLLSPTDYPERKFQPNQAITRYEIAVLADRVLGLVYPASQPVTEALSFTDQDTFQEGQAGYINEAAKAGVILGYPDGSFAPGKTATRAEAVTMVQRALVYMEVGLDPDIQVVARFLLSEPKHGEYPTLVPVISEKKTDEIRLQVVDQVVYASLHDLYQVEMDMIRESKIQNWDWIINELYFEWWPLKQQVNAMPESGNYRYYCFQAGNASYNWWDSYVTTEIRPGGRNTFCAPVRLLYGQLMIPVCDLAHPSATVGDGFQGAWDGKTNTLTIPLQYTGGTSRLS